MDNAVIAAIFDQMADVLDIKGANPFRVRAYRNAARAVLGLPQNIASIVTCGQTLPHIPGVGADLASKICEIAKTGSLSSLAEESKDVPRGTTDLLRLPGLGPKRVQALTSALGIRNVRDLERAARRGLIQSLPGFGASSEKKILAAVESSKLQASARRYDLMTAGHVAATLAAYLSADETTAKVVVAGSFRRRQETIGDLDILATGVEPKVFMRRLCNYDGVDRVLARGTTKSSVVLKSGMQVDVRVVPRASFGAALVYFTGSKSHNIALRTRALAVGLKVSEYGVFRGRARVAGRTEEDVYAALGLPYLEPELRENRGEIEAADKGSLPRLVTLTDIRGDLHAHTRATDGLLSLSQLADAAAERGYEYLAVTDHSRRLTVAHGLGKAALLRQIREIDLLNGKQKRIRILKGIEVDILEDGKLDLPDDVLRELDVTVCSVHSRFDLPPQKQFARVLRAMDNPYFRILGHPTGRLLQSRSPMALDMEGVLRAAKERGRFVELNAQPDRLDLNDSHCRLAKDLGVRVVISSDTHRATDLAFMELGVAQARRGWLEARNVLNTLPLATLLKALGRT